MIARSLFRVDLASKVTDVCITSSSLGNFQRCFFHRFLNRNLRIGIEEGLSGGMDRKKSKTVSHVWRRKVSTQSSGQQEHVKDMKIGSANVLATLDGKKDEVGSQVKEVQQSNLSHSTIQCEHEVEIGVSEEESIALAEKHSISVDAISSTQKHSISLEVGASLIRFIKGKWGATQKKIEDETGVKITFPSSRKEDFIGIEGDSTESITRASKRIEIIIDEAANSPSLDYSHFVSLPLAVHPELVDKLVKFQNSILGIRDTDEDVIPHNDSGADSSDEERGVQSLATTEVAVTLKCKNDSEHVNVDITSIPLVSYPAKTSKAPASDSKNSKLSELGIERSIFIKPETFHLTVLMLKLWNKERVEAAAKVLQSVSSKVMDALESRPLSIRLKGLECMKGSFAKARVLYVPVEEIDGEGRLLHACQVITDAFVGAGLVLEKDANQNLKLHATVMNARHRKSKMVRKKADWFDARSIVDQYGSEDWGEYLIGEAHLSQRFVFDENGYYHCCASIPLPDNMPVD